MGAKPKGDWSLDANDTRLASLPERERFVLLYRSGGLDGAEHTLDELAIRLGVSRERARQVESKALRRLRHPSRSKDLEEFLRGFHHGG